MQHGYATTCDTIIISCNLSISHTLTCPDIWGKGPKRPKTQKMIMFHNFEHSSMPISMIKQNKNNGANN